MGGVDQGNATGQVLSALASCGLPADLHITVVMGQHAPWLEQIREQAATMHWPTQVLVGVSNMAELMADCDLAFGAAGSTSWERCSLGVPTIMLVLADNQRKIAKALSDAGAAYLVNFSQLTNIQHILPKRLGPQLLGEISTAAAGLTDGLGVAKVIQILIEKVKHAN